MTLMEGTRIEEWGAAQFALSSEGTPEFRVAAPKTMFEGSFLNVPGVSDVAPDGKHFVMIEENQKQAPTTQLKCCSQLVLRTEAVARQFLNLSDSNK